MGVQGLWHLLQPCARPTKLESLEGKRLAIDSSIWLYHFQMAMRDKEGRTLSNAHILGFLWRILKLIHYGIRPIFVFDGGAPVMKRKTLVGRRQRKTGAKDDHRRIAEKLLNARLREAAISHVAAGGGATASTSQEANGDSANSGEGGVDSHGLGQNTVYFDDLAAGGAATSKRTQRGADDDPEWIDTIDDGGATALSRSKQTDAAAAAEREAEKKKKRNDWHKDPYALPALDRDINTLTANSSSAARSARGGGKRQDVRFATEGELRALLSSIGPTDLDLDSEFFRSLPSELQYELVGDMRAASRGTSYKRLQAMLSQSPTPIDFSRAQIAGLKTRNELTQKVLEVTDEIGDAHIKVPIRVAGARNREYVLVRNKGDQGGFALGVRDTGTTQEKAIAVDEDTASATTNDDDFERRTTDEEVDLEEVPIQASPEKRQANEPILPELLKANPNDPLERRKVAEELLQRRARALAKEKAKEKGITDEGEELEEQLRKIREARVMSKQGRGIDGGSAGSASLFRRDKRKGTAQNEVLVDLTEDVYDDDEEDEEEWRDLLEQHDAAELGRALDESEQDQQAAGSAEDADDPEDVASLELEEVPTHAFKALDYSNFHEIDKTSKTTQASDEIVQKPHWISASPVKSRVSPSSKEDGLDVDTAPSRIERATIGGPALGFRLQDRSGVPERLDPRLLAKRHWDEDEDFANENDESPANKSSLPDVPSKISSPDLSPGSKSKWAGHARAISLSDSDTGTSGEVVEIKGTSIRPDDRPLVTVRKETKILPGATGDELKVVDFQDKVETEGERISDSIFEVATPPRSPATELSEADEKTVNDELETKIGKSLPPSSVTEERVEEDGDEDVSIARRAEDRSPSPLMQASQATLGKETGEEVSFDNLTSFAEETGHLFGSEAVTTGERSIDESSLLPEEEDISRDSEDEHSDYSNRGFGRKGSDQGSADSSPEPTTMLGPDGFPLPTTEELAAMDAEDEAELGEMANDQDEFISFLSRAKGQGLNQVRKEVEDEVNKLKSEHATTRRTEGEVTIQMAKEIQFMLRLFGLPYITAPMEAEAQCAELLALKLADGIITDDSDVFLFGGTFIYKNMFNNKKYVECYKLSDLQHDLGMDRTKLVQLAYLLGSDYTEGLEGVGPVLAMEILSHFPGDDGLVKFRDWWLKVQMGRDTVKDTYDSTLKRLKRTLRNKVHLEAHWPDPNVIDAYFEPTVDNSREPFQWGLPDLDSLRSFFREYLRWDQEKTDHYLIPAIEEQNRRSKRQGTQSTLDRANFFDLSAGEGAFAARQRPTYGSSRLQQVITNFRASNAGKSKTKSRSKKTDGTSDGREIDLVSLSGEGDTDDSEAQPIEEELVGKERSRPVVHKNGAAKVPSREGSSKSKKKPSKKRKASSPTQEESLHDEEWRPAKSKRASRAKKTQPTMRGTSLSQARNMSLDNVSRLPPTRVGERLSSREVSQQRDASRAPMTISDEDLSSLSEQE